MCQQKFENAVHCYEQSISRDPKHLKSYYNLSLHARQTDYGLAISVLEKAYKLPEEIELFVQMVMCILYEQITVEL